ncbi:hypothetical protein RB195_020562 [Necator americanus]
MCCLYQNAGHTCRVCENLVNVKMIRMNKEESTYITVLLPALVLFERIDAIDDRRVYEECSQTHRSICQKHLMDAAQHIGGEMKYNGSGFLTYEDKNAVTVFFYEDVNDVPQHLVDAIDGIIKKLTDGAVTLRRRAVADFVNDCLYRYYIDGRWTNMGRTKKH